MSFLLILITFLTTKIKICQLRKLRQIASPQKRLVSPLLVSVTANTWKLKSEAEVQMYLCHYSAILQWHWKDERTWKIEKITNNCLLFSISMRKDNTMFSRKMTNYKAIFSILFTQWSIYHHLCKWKLNWCQFSFFKRELHTCTYHTLILACYMIVTFCRWLLSMIADTIHPYTRCKK